MISESLCEMGYTLDDSRDYMEHEETCIYKQSRHYGFVELEYRPIVWLANMGLKQR